MCQEKIRGLQDEISVLRSQEAELESRASCGGDAVNNVQTQELQNQVRLLCMNNTQHELAPSCLNHLTPEPVLDLGQIFQNIFKCI